MKRFSPLRRQRFRAFVAALIPAGWALLGVYACHSALPYNALRLPIEKRVAVKVWFPQGWCFFTRSPREDRLSVLLADGDGAFLPAIASQGHWRRPVGGFDRRERAAWIEAGILFASVAPPGWTECKHRPTDCLRGLTPAAEILNPSPNPRLCGRVGLVRQRVLPWAWAKSGRSLAMPSKVALVNVLCGG